MCGGGRVGILCFKSTLGYYTRLLEVHVHKLIVSVLPKKNSKHDRKGMVWVGPVATSKLLESLHFHIKGNSVPMACLADMPYTCTCMYARKKTAHTCTCNLPQLEVWAT